MSASDHRQLVHLRESETVVPHGHRKIVWFIRDHDRWHPAAAWPEADVTSEAPGPGTIWQRSIEVHLEPGHRLMRVDSRPRPREARDVLDYLRRETRLAERETLRRFVRVGPEGRLDPDEDSPNARRPRPLKGPGPQ